MDNTNKIALTLGFGALGTVLAYYGYNQLNEDDETEENKEINKIIENDETNSSPDKQDEKSQTTTQKTTEKKELTEQTNAISREIKKEIKELSETEKGNNDTQWSKYWENQYVEKEANENIAVL